jgi:hypothetical protein
MLGVGVGERWQHLAEKVQRQRSGRVLAFIDAHYVIATAAAEGEAAAQAMVSDLRHYVGFTTGTMARVTAAIGVPLAEAMIAYRAADYRRCVERLLPIRRALAQLGGSHAQRDLFAQLLLDASIRSGECALARALAAERLALRPNNRFVRLCEATIAAAMAKQANAASLL